jgi:hypothetical protein
MRNEAHDSRSAGIPERHTKPGRIAGAALFWLFGAVAHAQDSLSPSETMRMNHEMAQYGACMVFGCNGSGGGGTRIGYPPCMLAQNAMIPCGSEQGRACKPVGVDPNVVGTWELPFKGGPWVLEIRRDGTYKFHSEAGDGAPSQTGTFSANKGHWSLKATAYADGGDYLFQAPDIWIATGRLGAAAWRHPASVQDALHRCTAGQHGPAKTGGVDPDLVGTWELPIKGGPGRWVLEIHRNGTYRFHSEAGDGAVPHAGTFSASQGHWSLTATSGYAYSDAGVYLYQAPDIWMAAGHLGGAAWRRTASTAASCSK